MRLWSLHPEYLDTIGLVALWREALLAKNVLEGNTKGYKNHPQLDRFKNAPDPIKAIHFYLSEIFKESVVRGFHFNKSKFKGGEISPNIQVTKGQMDFEYMHLKAKLNKRSKYKYLEIVDSIILKPNLAFIVIDGEIEHWEKIF